MNTFLLSLAILVTGGAVPLLTHRRLMQTRWIYLVITLCGCIGGLAAILSFAGGSGEVSWSWTWLHVFTLSFSCDRLSLFFLLPIFLVCPLATVYGFGYFGREGDGLRQATAFFCTNLLIASMALVTAADGILSFALAWEVMSLSSFVLVMFDYEKESTRTAGTLYFLFAQAGALLIFAAFGVVFSHSGTMAFSGFATVPAGVRLLVFFLAFFGFGSKAGVFPLHIWLPHAHPAAPSHISAIMSGVMIKMGVYGILRVYASLAGTELVMGQVVLVFGMVSGVLGVLYALGKHNLKRLLAYHSVENIGIILMGAGLGMMGVSLGDWLMAGFGFAGCLLHVLNHSIFKSLLFFGAGAVLKKTGTGHVDELGGLMKRMPTTGRTFLIGSVSISGLPPFNGFISEFLVYYAAFQGLRYAGMTMILAVTAIIALAVIGGLASFCFTKVVGIVFLGEPRSDKAAEAEEADGFLTLPMTVLAAACLAIGIFPDYFIGLAFSGLSVLVDPVRIDMGTVGTVAANLALASRLFLVIFIFLAVLQKVLYRGKARAEGPTWGCGFTRPTTRIQYTGTSYARSVVGFFRPFVQVEESAVRLQAIFPGRIRYEARVDDIAETGLHRGAVLPLLALLGKFRWIQHGNVQLYIGYIIVTIALVLLVSFV